MTVRVNALIHFDEADVHRNWHPADDNCEAYGTLKFVGDATVFFYTTGQIDAVIAELVALKQEMDPPVITDSERDCPERHPGSGAPCGRSGKHAEHRDPDGETWTTAARVGVPERMPIPQSHYCDSGNCGVCGDGTGDEPAMCEYCDVEPATEGKYCEACAPAATLATAPVGGAS